MKETDASCLLIMGNSPRKIEGYRVTDKLGGGCFGTVYRTRNKTDTYAMKEIYRGKSRSAVETLQREAAIHEELPYHRNIVRFIECFRHNYRMYVVLEFCALGNLNDYVINNDISAKTVLYIMFDLARGLQHIHRHRILHRDIKPDNVLLSAGKFGIPTCKICDFGLAKRCSPTGTVGQTEGSDGPASDDGPMMYMAPEITSGVYSTACDVFSLGVLYFVLHSRQVTEFKGRKLLEPHISGYPLFSATDIVLVQEVRRHISDAGRGDLVIDMLKPTPNTRILMPQVLDTVKEIFSTAISDGKDGNIHSNGQI